MRFLVLAAVLSVAACSVYIPQPLDPPPPVGTQVRARLTMAGAVRISGLLSRPVQELEGQVLTVLGDSLGLGLLSATEYMRPWDSVDTLNVARGEIYQWDRKRIDGKRTALIVGAVGVVSGMVIAALFNAASGSEDDEPPGDIDGILIPILYLRH